MANEFSEFSEVYILFSYATLYSFICPLLSTIVFVYHIVATPLERHVHLKYLTRKPMLHQNGLGTYCKIIEWIGQCTVLLNCVFLYWFREQFIQIVDE